MLSEVQYKDPQLEKSKRIEYLEKLKKLRDLKKKQQILLARNDLFSFLNYAIQEGIPYGEPHRITTIALRNSNKVLVLLPKDHGKTTSVTIGYSAWMIGRNPNIRIKLVSYKDVKSWETVSAIESVIESSRYREVFPEIKPDPKKWSEKSFRVKCDRKSQDPTFAGYGVFSSSVGGHCEILIGDDVTDFSNSILEATTREKIKGIWKSVWLDLLQPGGQVVYLANVWHKDDLTQVIRDDPTYVKVEFPIDEKYTPIWPELWNSDDLKQREKDIGKIEFDRAFRLKAVSSVEREIDESLIENARIENLAIPKNLKKAVGVDIASSRKKVFDPKKSESAIFIIGYDGEFYYPLYAKSGNFKGPRLNDEILNPSLELSVKKVVVENNGVQGLVKDWIEFDRRAAGLKIIPFFTGSNKADLQFGIPMIYREFEYGKWKIPKHPPSCNCGICKWVQQLKDYPNGRTDLVMASWFAMSGLRKRSPSIRRLK